MEMRFNIGQLSNCCLFHYWRVYNSFAQAFITILCFTDIALPEAALTGAILAPKDGAGPQVSFA